MPDVRWEIPDNLSLPGAEVDRLAKLWGQLDDRHYLDAQFGDYPANHGERHISRVLRNIADLLHATRNSVNDRQLAHLLAAGMVHDIGMINMKGAESLDAQASVRQKHSTKETIQKLALPLLETAGFEFREREDICLIAQGHAGDSSASAEKKLLSLQDTGRSRGATYLASAAAVLQAADFFDIGPDRLCPNAKSIPWSEKQTEHLRKHLAVDATIDAEKPTVTLTANDSPPEGDGASDRSTRVAILRAVYEDAREKIGAVTRYAQRWLVEPMLTPLDESLIGSVWPVSSGVGLFGREFDRALSAASRQKPLDIDMMGHSLYARFIKDIEELNEKLKDERGHCIRSLRVLLLDPSVETQQMCEVLEAQKDPGADESERQRAIVSAHEAEGDIQATIDRLREWGNDVYGSPFTLEVRVTKRLMYTSIMRFGDRMIVTHYHRKGLSKASPAHVFPETSPLFDTYEAEFNSIWDSRTETRLCIHRHDPPPDECKALQRLIPGDAATPRFVPSLDYERGLLRTVGPRYRAWSEGSGPVPPFEIEIQPSANCNLNCAHCIGRHLGRPGERPERLTSENLQSILEYEVDDRRVERFRISGLLGDPLAGDRAEVTLQFVDMAKSNNREVVLLTNGVGLDESAREVLLTAEVDFVYVSLDAGTAKTFAATKGAPQFDKVKENVRGLAQAVRSRDTPTKVGIGFVVTQANFEDIGAAIDVADDVGAHFIRFKPDIRGLASFTWRTWKVAEERVCSIRDEWPQGSTTGTGGLEIICTSVPWHQYQIPKNGRCWAQYFFTCIGADGMMYACDHLTGIGESLGNLNNESFRTIWERSWGRLGKACANCTLCPPYNWCLNRMFDELDILREQYGWERLAPWIEQVLGS